MVSKSRKPWCVEPFSTIESKVWGDWGLCCRSKPLPYHSRDVSPLEHFNGPMMNRIRRDMIDHNVTDEIKHLCSKCIQHEANGVMSRRQGMQSVPIGEYNANGSMKNYKFRAIEIKFFGNLCNLKCKMCGPLYSSSIAAEQKKSGEYDGPVHHDVWAEYSADKKVKFYRDMAKIIPYANEIKFTGGEPMMNNGILDLVEWMVMNDLSHKISLRIITNGTKLNQDFLNYTKHFRSFHAMVSLDGVFDINDYQRTGSTFEDIDANIDILRNYGLVSCTTAITAINVARLYELKIYCNSKLMAYDMTSVTLTPPHLQIKVLPPRFRQWLLNTYDYNSIIASALRDPEWPVDLWEKFLYTNPTITELLPELEPYVGDRL